MGRRGGRVTWGGRGRPGAGPLYKAGAGGAAAAVSAAPAPLSSPSAPRHVVGGGEALRRGAQLRHGRAGPGAALQLVRAHFGGGGGEGPRDATLARLRLHHLRQPRARQRRHARHERRVSGRAADPGGPRREVEPGGARRRLPGGPRPGPGLRARRRRPGLRGALRGPQRGLRGLPRLRRQEPGGLRGAFPIGFLPGQLRQLR